MSGNMPYWGSLLMGLAEVISFTVIVVVWRKTRFRRKAKSYIEKLMKSGKFQWEVQATTENRRKYKEEPASSSSEEVYWEGDWAYIGGRYREIKIAGYRAVYCYKYFPQRKSGFRLSKQDYARQQMILNFKNGERYEAVELVSDFITRHLFRGIRVILFDDVTTTGRSFVQLADNLMDAGAT